MLVTINGSHLDFKCTESNLGKSIKSTYGVGDGLEGGLPHPPRAIIPDTHPLGTFENQGGRHEQ